MSRAGRELLMALVAPAVVVGLLVAAGDPEVRFRLRQNPFTAPRDVQQCRTNLKNVGTALEMYSTDASGRYPTTLASLTPNYLRVVPPCPSRGRDTYSEGFASASNPDWYTVVCRGLNHPGAGERENHPQNESVSGGLVAY